ncbi:MAG TPA: SLC13 family permease [Gammaproteobacteria bacterium]|nr:SLC13 family permease [Gammaproteobacteria bacterium]
MEIDAWITLAVIGLCFGLLVLNRIPPDVVLMGGLTLLLVGGILSPEQALSGLANEGMVTVGALYVVVSGLKETGAIAWVVEYILGRPKTLAGAQIRMMTPVAAMSAFLNNTPVVAMMIPAIQDWSRRYRLPISKLLIPLSYAAMVGGTCTLIGTSTNLVINGLLIKETGSSGLGIFELAWIGLPLTVFIIIAVIVLGKWLLPDRRSAISQFSDVRGYTVEMIVDPDGPLIGKTIEQAGLRQLPGLYLIEIDRKDALLPAVSPQEKLQANDRLVFAGVVESVVDLQKIRGLRPATNQVFKLNMPRTTRCMVEAVVSDSFPTAGKTIRESRFRNKYNAAIIAVARNGEQLKRKIGDIILRPGDVLLLEAPPDFIEQQRNSRDFYLISRLEDSSPPRHENALTAILILVAMVLSVATGILTMLKAAMLAAGLMLITKCTVGSVARRSVDWQVLIVIAASLGIGQALQVTGAAQIIAESLLLMAGESPHVALILIFTITALFTAVITNNTAAVLMFPIAMAASQALGVSYMPFMITIMVAASVSFATPIGYQTNLMVYGPGGYHFSDYIKIGIPLTILVGVIVVAFVPWIWAF